jgi:tetratricopeptide (TPR) repeat protein
MLDPHAEANALMDIGVAELALGNFEDAAEAFQKSTAIAELFPNWPYRPYHAHNRGVTFLLTNRLTEARAAFEEALNGSLSVDLWRIALMANCGLALCAQRLGDLVELHERCRLTRGMIEGRERIVADRALVDASLAWDMTLNEGHGPQAIAYLEKSVSEVARRDVDHWLKLELELIGIREHVSGRRAVEERSRLASLGRKYRAQGYERAALD